MSLAVEVKKAKLMRQYAGSKIDLNLDGDEKSEFLSLGKASSSRRHSIRKGSVFIGSKSPRHRPDDRGGQNEGCLLPPPGGRRKSRRYSTFQGLGVPLERSRTRKNSLLPSSGDGRKNSLLPGTDLGGRRSSLLPPGYSQRRKSSARRNSTFDAFLQKKGGRKFSINDDDDEENKLVIKDGIIKQKTPEEKAKIPKLKCSLLQDYARSRVTVEDEEDDDDLLVPEKRLNLLMASPSITRRRTSLMPSSSNSWNWQNNIQLPTLDVDKNDETDNDDEEELPLLAIPKLLLRRASTQLGFKGLGGLKLEQEENEDNNHDVEKIASNNEVSCEDATIREETEGEVEEDEQITIEIISEVPNLELSVANVQQEESERKDSGDTLSQVDVSERDTTVLLIPTSSENLNQKETEPEINIKVEAEDNAPNIKEKMIKEDKSKSRESVLYIEAESIKVPTYPRANEPPLEFYPYALTKSKNNILYVIAESLAIPRLFQSQGLKESQVSHSHDNPAYSGEAAEEPKESSASSTEDSHDIDSLPANKMNTSSVCDTNSDYAMASSANLSDFDDNRKKVSHEISTASTPVKVGTLFCPWSSEIADNSRSMPNIKSNSCNNSPILPHNKVKTPLTPDKLENPESITANDKTKLKSLDNEQGESFDPLDDNDDIITTEKKETENQILDANELLGENRPPTENVSMSRSSYFLPRSPTIETQDTFVDDEIEDDAYSKSMGCVPNFVRSATKLETIMSESSMDANTPEVNRKQESFKSSESSLGSLLDEYNDDDLEKTNATLVAILTVVIVLFFVLLFSTIFILAISLPSGHQGRLITHGLCRQIPAWAFIANSSDSWCDERIFMRPFDRDYQCPCFSPSHRPTQPEPLWPYTGVYVNH